MGRVPVPDSKDWTRTESNSKDSSVSINHRLGFGVRPRTVPSTGVEKKFPKNRSPVSTQVNGSGPSLRDHGCSHGPYHYRELRTHTFLRSDVRDGVPQVVDPLTKLDRHNDIFL